VASRFIVILVVAVLLASLCVLGLPRTTVTASAAPTVPPFLYTATKHYEPLDWMHGEDRFPSGAQLFVHDAQGNHLLVSSFTASADAAVSFDGRRVFFAGKKNAGDHWQIWEMDLPGGNLRRITPENEDSIRPFYLPEDRIVYAQKRDGRFAVETLDLATGKGSPLTYGPGNSLPTDVLRDGRILFEAAYPIGADGVPEIYTVYSDGSGVESYRCDHPGSRYSAKQIASGDVVFASSRGLARFTSARAQEVHIPAPDGEYAGGVIETSTGDWFVTWRAIARDHFQQMLWRPGSSTLHPVISDTEADAVEPVLITERVPPNRHPSGLHDWSNANLLCLNAYSSKYRFATGSIQSVRLYTRDAAGNPKLLGTAAVERDGSFFVQVPGEQPLQIELLDAAGKTLKRESGFFWMRRGEQRGCVGCHAGPETSPENAVPLVLLKSTTPADMTGATASGGH
jgi:hypothetical protein